MAGLIAYGAYIPYNRLQRSAIAGVLGEGGGSGTRSVASYDEDTTSMGVEAARVALRGRDVRPRRVYFATAEPAYLDKTNATAIHAALDLDAAALAVDMMGSVRSGVGALVAASEAPVATLAVLSDIRTGLPGGADERDGGDGAAAFVFGGAQDGPVLAEVLSIASTSDEFLDRWRIPGAHGSRTWEERFGEMVYVPMADAAFADALKQANVTPDQVDHLVVTGLHSRAVRSFAGRTGVRSEAVVDDRTRAIGNTGTAHGGVVLADVLDRAEPGAMIAVVVLADGASTIVLRATAALGEHRSVPAVATQVERGNDKLGYGTFLSWRGQLVKEPPRRPDPAPPYAPPAHRREDWKFAFVGSRCEVCGTINLPPGRVCLQCHSVDRMVRVPMADKAGTVVTYTIDRLAYTPSPPMVVAVIDFDGGGRFRSQLTDLDPSEVLVGLRVEMTFRRLITANNIHNYFWKAKPIRSASSVAGR